MSDLLSRLGGAAMSGLQGSPLDRILNGVMGGQTGASGVQGLVEKLRGNGLGTQVDSWVSPGANQPVAPQDLERALGEGEADRLSQGTGMGKAGLMAILAALLPMVVDRMSPQGRLPQTDADMPQGGLQGLLGGILGGQGAAPAPGQPGAAQDAGGLQGLLGGLMGGQGGQGAAGGLQGMLGGLLGGLGGQGAPDAGQGVPGTAPGAAVPPDAAPQRAPEGGSWGTTGPVRRT